MIQTPFRSNRPALRKMALLRRQIFNELKSDTSGLDIPRIKAFLKRQGISITPFLVIHRYQVPIFLDICRQGGIQTEDNITDNDLGRSYGALHLNLVIRDSDDAITEACLVHEEVHGQSIFVPSYVEYCPYEKEIGQSRTNFGTEGDFFEEGYANIIEKRYLHEFALNVWKLSPSDYPGRALEIINSLNPTIIPALHLANSTGNLSPLREAINSAMREDLFDEICSITDDPDGFVQMNRRLIGRYMEIRRI